MVIKTMIEQGKYEVDPRRVADAIIARLLGAAGPIVPAVDLQNLCSNPASGSGAPANTAPV